MSFLFQENYFLKALLSTPKQPFPVYLQEAVFIKFTKFTAKHLYRIVFSDKVASSRLPT